MLFAFLGWRNMVAPKQPRVFSAAHPHVHSKMGQD